MSTPSHSAIRTSYYRARYYDQFTGRFLSEDPFEFNGGDVNFYGYVGQRPTGLVDPSGLKPGDKYKTPDCAGWDAVHDILPQTKKDGLEHGGFIGLSIRIQMVPTHILRRSTELQQSYLPTSFSISQFQPGLLDQVGITRIRMYRAITARYSQTEMLGHLSI